MSSLSGEMGVVSAKAVVLMLLLAAIAPNGGQSMEAVNNNYVVSVNDQCTGAVLSSHYVLTSARCVHDNARDNFVRFKAGDLSDENSGERIQAKRVIKHDDYVQGGPDHLALIKLAAPIERFDGMFANYIRLFPQDGDKLSADSHLHLTGYEGAGKCQGPVHDTDVHWQQASNCGFRDADHVCIKTNFDLQPYLELGPDSLQCASLLVSRKRTLFGLGVWRWLTGIPIATPQRCPETAVRGFIRVSRHTNWIMENTDDEATILDAV